MTLSENDDDAETDYSNVLEILNGECLAYIPIQDSKNEDVIGVPPFNKDWKDAWDLDELFRIFPYMEDDGNYDWEAVNKIDFSKDGFYNAYDPEVGLYAHKDLGVYVIGSKIACVLFKEHYQTKIRIGNLVLEQE